MKGKENPAKRHKRIKTGKAHANQRQAILRLKANGKKVIELV